MLDLTSDELLHIQCTLWPDHNDMCIVFPTDNVRTMFCNFLGRHGADIYFISWRHDEIRLKDKRRILLITRQQSRYGVCWRGLHLGKIVYFDHGKLYVFDNETYEPREVESLDSVFSQTSFTQFRLEAGEVDGKLVP